VYFFTRKFIFLNIYYLRKDTCAIWHIVNALFAILQKACKIGGAASEISETSCVVE